MFQRLSSNARLINLTLSVMNKPHNPTKTNPHNSISPIFKHHPFQISLSIFITFLICPPTTVTHPLLAPPYSFPDRSETEKKRRQEKENFSTSKKIRSNRKSREKTFRFSSKKVGKALEMDLMNGNWSETIMFWRNRRSTGRDYVDEPSNPKPFCWSLSDQNDDFPLAIDLPVGFTPLNFSFCAARYLPCDACIDSGNKIIFCLPPVHGEKRSTQWKAKKRFSSPKKSGKCYGVGG